MASKSLLVQLVRAESADTQLAMWERAKTGGISVSQARVQKKGSPAPKKQSSPVVEALAYGRHFVRKLEGVPSEALQLDREAYIELLSVRKAINDLVDSVTPPEPA